MCNAQNTEHKITKPSPNIISELEKVFTSTKNQGNRVMALIANACATSTGLFDPIDEMANFCRKHKIWFHVDGAHGSVALLSKKKGN